VRLGGEEHCLTMRLSSPPPPPAADAHLHPQRSARCALLLAAARRARVAPLAVCATSEADFGAVLALARAHPRAVAASLGTHPWWAGGASCAPPDALAARLEAALDAAAAAAAAAPEGACGVVGVGEIGLDRSRRGLAAAPLEAQLAVFRAQLRVAARRGLPASLHCVQAYGQVAEELAAVLAEVGAGGGGGSGGASNGAGDGAGGGAGGGASDGASDGAGGGDSARGAAGALRGFGVLFHSFGGSADFAQGVLQLAPQGGSTPLLFSFNGSVAVSAANEFVQRNAAAAAAAATATAASAFAVRE